MAVTIDSSAREKENDVINEVRKIAVYLDSQYTLPFGWKVGWDGILGLIPGVGDVMTNVFSFYIIYKAAMIGCSPFVILRMGLNVLIDNLVDVIPVIGNIFDFMWKANNKNVALLEQFLADPRKVTRSSRFVVILTLLFVASVFIGLIVLTFYLIIWILGFLKQSV